MAYAVLVPKHCLSGGYSILYPLSVVYESQNENTECEQKKLKEEKYETED